ncbi:MAG: DNA-processing protein DprA [Chitinophagaceae bacterium]
MIAEKPISFLKEAAAYEALWDSNKASIKTLSGFFSRLRGINTSALVTGSKLQSYTDALTTVIHNNGLQYKIRLLVDEAPGYPVALKDAKEPVKVLYYSGNPELLQTRCIAIVGTRKPSAAGLARTTRLVKMLVKDNFTIVSGLAAGIDTQAHTTAIACKGKTIAVIGTPMDEVYPQENTALQQAIANDHLLISQVPFLRYRKQSYLENRLFFPERNKTMSALSEATVIIEAGDRSGTLIQAQAALYQKRKLFILDSCFQDSTLAWPQRYLAMGAIRVKEYEEIVDALCE